MIIPAALRKNIQDIYGDQGNSWLERLPDLIHACESRWGIQVLEPYANLSYNFVARARETDGTLYVLKLGPPDDQLRREATALRHYQGDGIAHLVEADPDIAALLLEHLDPGISRWDAVDDDPSTRIAASLMKRLWRPVPDPQNWRSLDSWTEALFEVPDMYGLRLPFPVRLTEKAQALYRKLAGTTPPVLLHADLHHDNILSATREPYLAIDPKGIVGDAAYDVGPFLINPMPSFHTWPDLHGALERRVTIFSEMLELDPRVVAAWGVIHAVLSACWSVNDHGGGWEPALTCAEQLEHLV